VSYKWGGPGDALVDDLQNRLAKRGIPLVRDRTTMQYRDSIREFMQTLGAGKCIVLVLDDGYLRSPNCMFELTEIAAHSEYVERVFPVVMPNAAIYDPIGLLEYVEYWEGKIAKLDAAMRRVNQDNLQGIREELDLYRRIRSTVAGILAVLSDRNALTPEMHCGSDFVQLYRALDAALNL
jgi:hypothetical protein